MNKVTIIAEAGVNHNGDIGLAKKMIEVAAEAGVDYVKFQTFVASKLVSQNAKKAQYQENTTNKNEGQFEMLKKLELSVDDHYELIEYCEQCGIKFLSTAFDLDGLELLHSLGLRTFKVPSGEITNLPYLEKMADLAENIILSTGMTDVNEIENALSVFRDKINGSISILHCNTAYPTPFEDVNLLAMPMLKEKFNTEIGYSDHTIGIEVPIAATALGATIIEKHFTLDRNMDGPDHYASIEPFELIQMTKSIRNIELALGSKEKKPSQSELLNIAIARKSIHLIRDKKKGESLEMEDLIMLRPGDGISPMNYKNFVGLKLRRSLKRGHKLAEEDFI